MTSKRYAFNGMENNNKIILIKTDLDLETVALRVRIRKRQLETEKQLITALDSYSTFKVSHKPVNEA